MAAAWLLVPAVVVLAVFVGASLRALSPHGGEVAERVAGLSFYGCLFAGAVILLGLWMFR